jgi:hypothetical protein
MNTRPIESALDADLRLSRVALQRAVKQAHRVAAQTGTFIVISRNGIVEQVAPDMTAVPSTAVPPALPSGAAPR